MEKITRTSIIFQIFLLIINRWLFAFLSVLIYKKWFNEIILTYLSVDHTHEKVDRDLFAPIGTKKRVRNCETPPDFTSMIKACFKRNRRVPSVDYQPKVWD